MAKHLISLFSRMDSLLTKTEENNQNLLEMLFHLKRFVMFSVQIYLDCGWLQQILEVKWWFTDEILKQVSDQYRRIRNTFKFLLGNMFDYDSRNAISPLTN